VHSEAYLSALLESSQLSSSLLSAPLLQKPLYCCRFIPFASKKGCSFVSAPLLPKSLIISGLFLSYPRRVVRLFVCFLTNVSRVQRNIIVSTEHFWSFQGGIIACQSLAKITGIS